MGAELGFTVLYGIYIVLAGPVLFVVLAVRSRAHIHARYALVAATAFASVAGIGGALWWASSYPEGFSVKLLAALYILPAVVIGAATYGVVIKLWRQVKR